MEYNAVTFDTVTVVQNGFDFDGGLLNQLKQLRHDTIRVVVSDVVKKEILKHLSERNQQALSKLDGALKKARDLDLATIDTPDVSRERAHSVARARLFTYFENLNATILSPEDVSVTEVLDRYFANTPPFGKADKKAEFPDAITLLALEGWAKKNDFQILAISSDNDWKRFSKDSAYITVVDTIADGLDILNAQKDDARRVAGKYLDSVANDEDVKDQLASKIEGALDRVYVLAEGQSAYYVEGERADLILNDFGLVAVEDFDLLSVDHKTGELVVSVDAYLDVQVHAHFSLSAYDAIDRGYVGLGGVNVRRLLRLPVSLMITLTVDVDQIEVNYVDVTNPPSSVDFGNLEQYWQPDFGDPDPDDIIPDE